MRAAVRIAVRWAGYAVGGVGVFALWLAVGVLLEGVTHMAGEGQPLPADTPEGRRERLMLVGVFIAVGVCGIGLGAAAVAWAREPRRPVRLAGLVGNAILFAGGVCLFYGLLVLAATVPVRFQVDPLYLWLGGGAVAVAPALILTGAWLRPRDVSVAPSGTVVILEAVKERGAP
jgi:hypothetical protein